MSNGNAVRWPLVILMVLLVVALVALARGNADKQRGPTFSGHVAAAVLGPMRV